MKYADQYESSYDPWPRSVLGWIAWLVFMMPGSLILWFQYMFPERGTGWGSWRRAQNRRVTVMTTLGFYLFVALFFGYLFAMRQTTPR